MNRKIKERKNKRIKKAKRNVREENWKKNGKRVKEVRKMIKKGEAER